MWCAPLSPCGQSRRPASPLCYLCSCQLTRTPSPAGTWGSEQQGKMRISCSSPTNLWSIPSGLFPENWKVPASDAGREACVLEAAGSHAGFLPRGRTATGASNWTGAPGLRSVPSDLRGSHGLGLESEVGILLRSPPSLRGWGDLQRLRVTPLWLPRTQERQDVSADGEKHYSFLSLSFFVSLFLASGASAHLRTKLLLHTFYFLERLSEEYCWREGRHPPKCDRFTLSN